MRRYRVTRLSLNEVGVVRTILATLAKHLHCLSPEELCAQQGSLS